MAKALTLDQKRVLRVLAYMFFRMGQFDRAKRIYRVLVEIEDEKHPDVNAHMALAAISIRQEDGKEALAHLRKIDNPASMPTKDASYLFMKAQSYWIEGRKTEAKTAIDEYLYFMNSKGKAGGSL